MCLSWANPGWLSLRMTAMWWSHSLHSVPPKVVQEKLSCSSRIIIHLLWQCSSWTRLMVSHGDNHEPTRHHELNPNQSSQKACSLAMPDVNTCCSFAYGNEEDDSKSDRVASVWAFISVGTQWEFVFPFSFVCFNKCRSPSGGEPPDYTEKSRKINVTAFLSAHKIMPLETTDVFLGRHWFPHR